MKPERVSILGVNVSSIRFSDFLECIDSSIRSGKKHIFAYANVHAVNVANRIPWFRDFLNNAEITYADGEGVRLGAKLLGSSLPEKIALTRKLWDIASFCEEKNYSLFLLGSSEQSAQQAAIKLKGQFPKLNVRSHHGYFNETDNEDIVDSINQFGTKVLIVGLGMPKQEEWILNNCSKLNVNAILPGGSCIDYAAGARPACPEWISKIGFEWLFRFLYEPRRLFTRYFGGNILFLLRIIAQRFQSEIPGKDAPPRPSNLVL